MTDQHNNPDNFNVVQENEARVNVTYSGHNGDMPQPIPLDAADGDIRSWVTEAVRNGTIPGIPADADADFRDFVIERFPPTEARPWSLVSLRPKVPFGAH